MWVESGAKLGESMAVVERTSLVRGCEGYLVGD